MTIAIHVFLIGIFATAFIDAVAQARRVLFGTKPPDYALVGRWLGGMLQGRFRHEAISRAPPIAGEVAVGWAAHYGIGVAFAAMLPLLFGVGWLARPTIVPALLLGIATVAAPFVVMQPAMGAGFAASRTPRPAAARAQSLANHFSFGVGLCLSGNLVKLLTA
jgi:hypothetical protein